jgi:hypothetical protein
LAAAYATHNEQKSRFQIDEAQAREAIRLGQKEDVEALQKFFEPYNAIFFGVTDPPVERITLDTRFSRIATLAATQHRTDHLYTEKEAFAATEELEKNIILQARMFFFTSTTLEPGKEYRMIAYQDDEEMTTKFVEYKNLGAPPVGSAWEVVLSYSVPLEELDAEQPLRVVLESPEGPFVEAFFELAKLK